MNIHDAQGMAKKTRPFAIVCRTLDSVSVFGFFALAALSP